MARESQDVPEDRGIAGRSGPKEGAGRSYRCVGCGREVPVMGILPTAQVERGDAARGPVCIFCATMLRR